MQDSSFKHLFTYRVETRVDPEQPADLDLHCFFETADISVEHGKSLQCVTFKRIFVIFQKFLSNSQAQTLMKHLRAIGPSPPWTYQIDPSLLTKLSSALTPEEILSVPSHVFMERYVV